MAKDSMTRRDFMRVGAGAAAIGTGVRGCNDLSTALRAPGVERWLESQSGQLI